MLCLGDSYTIGQSVETHERFPEQTISLLNRQGFQFVSPQIIARTGWTSRDLINAIESNKLSNEYDIVTLLIGVNDQFQGKSKTSYESNFEWLLKMAVAFAGGKSHNVYVLNIPDYGVTPYAARMSQSASAISNEIDQFNAINKSISLKHKVNYIDITEISRRAKNEIDLLADDGLHPSGKMYREWATILSEKIIELK